jgi:HEAT repeat protein
MTDPRPRTPNFRTFAYPLAALAIVVALLKLQPDRGERGSQGTTPEATPAATPAVEDAEFRFLRPAQLSELPESLIRGGPIDDPVDRWFQVAMLAPLDVRERAVRQLRLLEDPIQKERFAALAEEEWRRDPLRAYVLLPALAAIGIERADEIVVEAAAHPRNLVRGMAARALAWCEDPRAVEKLELLADDPFDDVRSAAIRSLIETDADGAFDALLRLAEKYPDDRTKHVIFRLGEDLENPSAIPLLRRYLDSPQPLRDLAVRMLTRFGDLSTMDVLYATLERGGDPDKHRALLYLLDAPLELVDETRIIAALETAAGETRRLAYEILLRMAREGVIRDEARVTAVVEKGLSDAHYDAQRTALAALHALGRKSVVEPYLKAIATAEGHGLFNALEVATLYTGDERAIDAIIARLAAEPPPGPNERSMLITALGSFEDERVMDPLAAAIAGATLDEAVDGNRLTVSARAAQYVDSLGVRAQAGLLALVNDVASTPIAKLRALDALRGIVGLDCVDELIAVALDDAQPEAVRLAAIDTLCFVDGAPIYEPLAEALDRLATRPLKLRAFHVLMAYG